MLVFGHKNSPGVSVSRILCLVKDSSTRNFLFIIICQIYPIASLLTALHVSRAASSVYPKKSEKEFMHELYLRFKCFWGNSNIQPMFLRRGIFHKLVYNINSCSAFYQVQVFLPLIF